MEKRRDTQHAAEEIEQPSPTSGRCFPSLEGSGAATARRSYVIRSEDPPALTVQIELPGVDPQDVRLIAGPQVLVISR